MAISTSLSDLDQVIELNHMFLKLLRQRVGEGRPCFGLPASAVRELRSASDETLESLGQLPRALFRLDLEAARAAWLAPSGRPALDAATLSLQLGALLTAWTMSRRSTYSARLFLGLAPEQLAALRALPFSVLPRLANDPDLLGCAFEQTAWLWRELLTEERPEKRRHLLLVALQPQRLLTGKRLQPGEHGTLGR